MGSGFDSFPAGSDAQWQLRTTSNHNHFQIILQDSAQSGYPWEAFSDTRSSQTSAQSFSSLLPEVPNFCVSCSWFLSPFYYSLFNKKIS